MEEKVGAKQAGCPKHRYKHILLHVTVDPLGYKVMAINSTFSSKEMEAKKRSKVVLVPYPAQGHVNPMVKLASALLSCGFDPVIITPQFLHRRITSTLDPTASILCIPIPDGLQNEVCRDFFAIENALENVFKAHFETFLRKFSEVEEDEGGRVLCVIVDLLASPAMDVARWCRLPVAGFWPAMVATYHLIQAIPDMVRTGVISDCGIPQHQAEINFLSSQPSISTSDLPWLIGTQASRKGRFKFWTRILDRSRNLPWIVTNSFQDESSLKSNNKASTPLLFHIGSLNTSINKPRTLKNPSFWEEDKSSLQWLDKQRTNSVMYISFGSWVSPIGEEKVRSLALALESTKQPFIWVLAPGWRDGLPEGYIERVEKQGKIVSWAPQMEILQHRGVKCYLSHCGWNSTMEAIQCRKPMLCYPVAGDQFVNCAYIVEKWKVGVRLNGLGLKDVKESLEKLMDDKEMENRMMRLCEKAVGEEASLRAMCNLTTFLDHLCCKLKKESFLPFLCGM